jgi:hypothetical protein
MAHQAGQRWKILFGRRVTGGHREHVANRDLLHVPAELSGKTVRAPEVSGVEGCTPAGSLIAIGRKPEHSKSIAATRPSVSTSSIRCCSISCHPLAL